MRKYFTPHNPVIFDGKPGISSNKSDCNVYKPYINDNRGLPVFRSNSFHPKLLNDFCPCVLGYDTPTKNSLKTPISTI